MTLDQLAAAAREALPLLLWALGVLFVVVYGALAVWVVWRWLVQPWLALRAERREAQRRNAPWRLPEGRS